MSPEDISDLFDVKVSTSTLWDRLKALSRTDDVVRNCMAAYNLNPGLSRERVCLAIALFQSDRADQLLRMAIDAESRAFPRSFVGDKT
jgi:hypothetical protein